MPASARMPAKIRQCNFANCGSFASDAAGTSARNSLTSASAIAAGLSGGASNYLPFRLPPCRPILLHPRTHGLLLRGRHRPGVLGDGLDLPDTLTDLVVLADVTKGSESVLDLPKLGFEKTLLLAEHRQHLS